MKPRLRTLVVDDEAAARRLLTSLLAEHPDIEVTGACRNGLEAVQWLSDREADLLFLDIRMPGLDGFEVLEALDEPPGAVVFVTAYDEFAVRAFEAEAWDYLLKPYDGERLGQALDRVRRRLARETGEPQSPPELAPLLHHLERPPLERIAVPKGRQRVAIRLADVLWIGAESNYVRFHLADASYLARRSLSSLAERLDPQRFVRVHRSAIVNVEWVARLEPLGHGDLRLLLRNEEAVTLSRRYREDFERVLESLP